jgi:hypothetical protein
MKKHLFIALTFVLFVSRITAEPAHEQPKAGRDGSTFERAIIMRGSDKTFDAAAAKIIKRYYPDAKIQLPIAPTIGGEGNSPTLVQEITFDTAKHGRHTMYFDVTHVK